MTMPLKLEYLTSVLALVEHYILVDAKSEKVINSDVFEAALTALLTITRDCSESIQLVLHYFEGSMDSTRCFDELKQEVQARLMYAIWSAPNWISGFEPLLLSAYAGIGEESSMHYKEALEIDDRAVLHSIRLAKRLQQHGFSTTALAVLDSSIDAAREKDLNIVVFNNDDYMGSGFTKGTDDQFLDNSNLVLSTLIDARTYLAHGLKLDNREYFRSVLPWDN